MNDKSSALSTWTPAQIALGKRWVQAWKGAGPELDRIRRNEIVHRNNYDAITLLLGSADYTKPPHAPKSSSGLVEQQRWFKKLARE
jgi:hypothetical protein